MDDNYSIHVLSHFLNTGVVLAVLQSRV